MLVADHGEERCCDGSDVYQAKIILVLIVICLQVNRDNGEMARWGAGSARAGSGHFYCSSVVYVFD